jgi:small GTP-binding protein
MKNNNNEICDYIAKVVVIGESSVGKTNILSRFSRNEFSIETKSTIGVEFLTKISEIKGKKIKLQIWDTAGQEKYKAITNSFYCNSNAALIVFDLSIKETFERVDYWVKEVKKYTREDIILILIGNKSDLERQVSFESASEKAEKLSMREVK